MTGLVMLGIGLTWYALLVACDRGHRTPGPLWFDIPHTTANRAGRRHG